MLCRADSFISFPPQLWEVYGERRCIRTFIGELSYIFIWQTLLSVNKSWYEMVTEYSPPTYNTSSTTMDHQQTCWREICSRSEIYAAFWEMHSSDRLWAQHYWDANDTSADRWKKVYGFLFFFLNGVRVEGCRLMVCRSLLCPSQRRHTVWIEIVLQLWLCLSAPSQNMHNSAARGAEGSEGQGGGHKTLRRVDTQEVGTRFRSEYKWQRVGGWGEELQMMMVLIIFFIRGVFEIYGMLWRAY